LEADGYLVLLAPNGREGLSQAFRERPNLILVDIHLQGLDGYEVARRLRQMDHTRHIPILAVSTSGNPEDKDLSVEVGYDDYIVKPIDVDLISKQIAAYL
jgi:CheY-like chemotaxis protein